LVLAYQAAGQLELSVSPQVLQELAARRCLCWRMFKCRNIERAAVLAFQLPTAAVSFNTAMVANMAVLGNCGSAPPTPASAHCKDAIADKHTANVTGK
jgi:hypothetical protein